MTKDELQFYAYSAAEQAGHPQPELFVAKLDDAEIGDEQPMDDIDAELEKELRFYEANNGDPTAVIIDQQQGSDIASGYRTTGAMPAEAKAVVDQKFRAASEFGRVGLKKVQDKLFGGGDTSHTLAAVGAADDDLDRLLTDLVKSV